MASPGRRAVFTVGFISNDATTRWASPATSYGWSPRADVCETPEALHYEIEVPGTTQENLKLHFEAGQLVIEGVRESKVMPSPRRCLQVEIEHGPFRRALPVPVDADAAAIEAHYEAGVLYVTIPRAKPAKPQSLKIEVS